MGGTGDFDSAVDEDQDFRLRSAYVQITNNWGTFIGGKTNSFFDFWGSYGYSTRLGIDELDAQLSARRLDVGSGARMVHFLRRRRPVRYLIP